MKMTTRFGASVLLLAALSLSSCDKNKGESGTATEGGEPSVAKTAPDGSYVSLSGTVTETDPHKFELDYGNGKITVEMDDWDWYPEGHLLLVNDDVIVYGYVDDDFYEKRTIEASSVYVSDVGTQFYASGVDEEDFPAITTIALKPQLQLRGTVTAITADEFKLDTGAGVVDVNIGRMPYNPLDKEGFQKIKPNDRVSVTGSPGIDFFNDLDLMAETVITLQPSKKKEREKEGKETG